MATTKKTTRAKATPKPKAETANMATEFIFPFNGADYKFVATDKEITIRSTETNALLWHYMA